MLVVVTPKTQGWEALNAFFNWGIFPLQLNIFANFSWRVKGFMGLGPRFFHFTWLTNLNVLRQLLLQSCKLPLIMVLGCCIFWPVFGCCLLQTLLFPCFCKFMQDLDGKMIQARIAQLVAYRLGTGEVPVSNPGKGENFSVKISNWIVWKRRFQPSVWVRSTQTLVKIYNIRQRTIVADTKIWGPFHNKTLGRHGFYVSFNWLIFMLNWFNQA